MIRIPNDKIACRPLNPSLEKSTKAGFMTLKNKTQLLETTVVFENAQDSEHRFYHYAVGDTVYLRGDVVSLPWVKEPMELNGETFILVPCDQIQAWDRKRDA